MRFDFNPKKAAQATGVLLSRNGGDMDKYLLIKLLYLADKEALKRWDEPITGDQAASMPYGPVLSTVYDLTKGDCPSLRGDWEPCISDADQHTNRVTLKQSPGVDELSPAEVAILEFIHEQFKDFTFGQMRDYCHKLPEYEDVRQGSKPIHPEAILKAVGKTEAQIQAAVEHSRGVRMAELLLS